MAPVAGNGMTLADFDFDLPDNLIALRPAEPRESARLLVVDSQLRDCHVADLPSFLRAGDIMVFNDTRVIPARLTGRRGAAKVEITLHLQEGPGLWRAFARPARKCRIGDVIDFTALTATVMARGDGGEVVLQFDRAGDALRAGLAQSGVMPLPPYIASRRPVDARDQSDYQTVYAAREGAVAAPTAGLHFTPTLLDQIDRLGVRRVSVTLHVGAGTFLPVKVDRIAEHKMHGEYGEVSAATAQVINAARLAGGRLVAVGTTSLRLLESAAADTGEIHPFAGVTEIFITPGYRFKTADILMTNFHLPKSTLFMLVSAFAGHGRMRSAYAHAVAHGYRFYSYGDASLLFRADDHAV